MLLHFFHFSSYIKSKKEIIKLRTHERLFFNKTVGLKYLKVFVETEKKL